MGRRLDPHRADELLYLLHRDFSANLADRIQHDKALSRRVEDRCLRVARVLWILEEVIDDALVEQRRGLDDRLRVADLEHAAFDVEVFGMRHPAGQNHGHTHPPTQYEGKSHVRTSPPVYTCPFEPGEEDNRPRRRCKFQFPRRLPARRPVPGR